MAFRPTLPRQNEITRPPLGGFGLGLPWRERLALLRQLERDEWLAGARTILRHVNPIVAYRTVALILALVIVASDLHVESSLQRDAWILVLAGLHLLATCALVRPLPRMSDRVNVAAVVIDIVVCVALLDFGHGWRGPFWLYAVSAVFWPSYRFRLRAALLSVFAFNALVLLTGPDSVGEAYDDGYAGDLVARSVMVLLVAGAVAITARALSQVRRFTAEAERNRIARDLHDGVGKTMGGISLEASSLAWWIERDPSEAVRRARFVARISERAAIEVRDVIRSLRALEATAPLLEDVRRITDEWQRIWPGKLHLQLNGPDIEVPVLIRGEVLRMLEELLDNVARHSFANNARVRVTLSSAGVTLATRDDGIGFEVDRLDPWSGDGHFGLLGARERASMLGGWFKLNSAPGHGTEVTIDLPLAPREERAARR